MKQGQLVMWSSTWIAGGSKEQIPFFKSQIGFVLGIGKTNNCFLVVWDNGQCSDVHKEYLEAI